MIPCICIDDSNRPNEIPVHKWVAKGEQYHITFVSIQVNQGNIAGCDLYEKPLGENEFPYECFKLARFAVTEENLKALFDLIEACYNLPQVDIQKMIEESELKTI